MKHFLLNSLNPLNFLKYLSVAAAVVALWLPIPAGTQTPLSVSISCVPSNCRMQIGGTITLRARINRSNTSNYEFLWQGNDGTIAEGSGKSTIRWTTPASWVDTPESPFEGTSMYISVDVFNNPDEYASDKVEVQIDPRRGSANRPPTISGVDCSNINCEVAHDSILGLTVNATDPDSGDYVKDYHWTASRGELTTALNENGERGTSNNVSLDWTPPTVSRRTSARISVRVTDTKGRSSSTFYKTVTALPVPPGSAPPKVTLSCNPCTVREGETVSLSARATDDGTIESYEWHQNLGGVFLGDTSQSTVRWQAPDFSGDSFVITVVVFDDLGQRAEASVTIKVLPPHPLPSPRLTVEATCHPCRIGGHYVNRRVHLNAYVKNPGNRNLTYKWEVRGDAGVLLTPEDDNTVWVPPSGRGTYLVTVTVDDGNGGRDSDSLTITTQAYLFSYTLPEAEASVLTTPPHRPNRLGLFRGVGSSPYGEVRYHWKQTEGPEVALTESLQGDGSTQLSLVTPKVASDTDIGFKLRVIDPYGHFTEDNVRVTVKNQAPRITGFYCKDNPSCTYTKGSVSTIMTLVMEVENPDGDNVNLKITEDDRSRRLIAGYSSVFNNNKLVREREFKIWDNITNPGKYGLTLTVDDEKGGTDSAQLTITVQGPETEILPVPEPTWPPQNPIELDTSILSQTAWYSYYTLDTEEGDSDDWFTFTLTEPKLLSAGLYLHGINLDMFLKRESGGSFGQSWASPNYGTIEQFNRNLDPGTYYFQVKAMESGRTGYVIRFELQDPRNPYIRVSDAKAEEGTDDSLDFIVSLDQVASNKVTLRYRTVDGTAIAGQDYTAKSALVELRHGERWQKISVPVLTDSHNEGPETMTLMISNASGGVIRDSKGIGTITNSDPMPDAYLSRFGRTVGSQAVDVISSRMGESSPGIRLIVGGRDLSPAEKILKAKSLHENFEKAALTAQAGTHGNKFETEESREITMEDIRRGSSFSLSSQGEGEGDNTWSFWGEFLKSHFSGKEEGLNIKGEVQSGFIGADVTSGNVKGGLAFSQSEGKGSFRHSGLDPESSPSLESGEEDKGRVESRLTSVYPYVGYNWGEDHSVWGFVGFGEGDMTLTTQQGEVIKTDISMRMGAVGANTPLMSQEEGAPLNMTLKTDGMYVQMRSEKVSGQMQSSKTEVTRLRATLDTSRDFELGEGLLTPSFQLGVRKDGGDAEEGFGVETGGKLSYRRGGFLLEGQARTLLAHEERDYKEWGASLAVKLDPGSQGRGLSFSLLPTWGNNNTSNLWEAQGIHQLSNGRTGSEGHRLEGEIGYGFNPFERLLGIFTPYFGFSRGDNSRAYRTGTRWSIAPGADLSLELSRTKTSGEEDEALMLKGGFRW